MNRFFKSIFIFSLLLYLGSSFYVRMNNSIFFSWGLVLLDSFPVDAFPLKYVGKKNLLCTQIGVLSSSEVKELLRANPEEFPHMDQGLLLKETQVPKKDRDYAVLRFKNRQFSKMGGMKVYLPYFSYADAQFIDLPCYMEEYFNFIIPYSESLEGKREKSPLLFGRWKNLLEN